MPYDMIQGQGQGHRGLKDAKMANFVVYLLRQYACNQQTNGELWYSKTIPNFFLDKLIVFHFWQTNFNCYKDKESTGLGYFH